MTVVLPEFLAHMSLFRHDLKPIHVNHEHRKQRKTRDIAEQNAPAAQHEQETDIHRISRCSINSANDEAGWLIRHPGVDSCARRPKLQHAQWCENDAGGRQHQRYECQRWERKAKGRQHKSRCRHDACDDKHHKNRWDFQLKFIQNNPFDACSSSQLARCCHVRWRPETMLFSPGWAPVLQSFQRSTEKSGFAWLNSRN